MTDLRIPTFPLSPRDVWGKALQDDLLALKGPVETAVQRGELVVNVKNHGAKGDGVTDDTAAIQDAVDACIAAGGGAVFFPAGGYVVSSTIDISGNLSNLSGRPGGITLLGVNMYQSVILSSVVGYTFSAGSHGDALHVENLCVKTTTGGGFTLNDSGNVSFNRFFMDGCGAGYWGVYATVPYPITIDGCRFWHATNGYQGGAWYIEGAIAVNLRANFVSMQQKNGDVTVLKDCYSINHQSGMYESRALGGAAFTSQVMISLQGTNQSGYIDGIYTECQANKIINITAGTAARGLRIGSIYAFQRDDNTLGDPNFMAIDCGATALSTPLPVDSLVFISQPAGTGGYIINDPNGNVSVRTFRNTSTGNQALRNLKATAAQPVGARLFNSAAQSISSAVTTALSFDSETFDGLGFHSPTVTPTRFTVPKGAEGTYLCVAQLAMNGVGGSRRAFVVRVNGSNVGGVEYPPPVAGTVFRIQVHEVLRLVAGDYVEVMVFQDSGAGLTTTAGDAATWASLVKVG